MFKIKEKVQTLILVTTFSFQITSHFFFCELVMIFRIVVPVLRINNQQEKEETDFPWKEMKWLIYIFKQKPGSEQTFELD